MVFSQTAYFIFSISLVLVVVWDVSRLARTFYGC